MPTLTQREARLIAVRAQLLDAYRPGSLLEVVDQLTIVQIDPTNAVAPSADLVAWGRLGASYSPSDLRFALEQERSLVEHGSYIRPMADVGLVLATTPLWGRHARAIAWVEANQAFRADVLARLRTDGPLPAAAIPDTAAVPWHSSGWTHDKNVALMLESLVMLGEVAVAGRDGRTRRFDLSERVYPADLTVPEVEVARAELARRRLASLGIARARSAAQFAEPVDVGPIGEEVVVEGVPGTWRVDPDALAALDQPFRGRTALLSPFDRLVYDRDRTREIFGFDYVLEMYKPASRRRWGYFALPVLHGDRLVGKVDAKADRAAGVLRVHDVHQDVPFTEEVARAVDAELESLAAWLGLAVGR